MGSFNKNDNNEVRILLRTKVSQRAGEKGSNRFLPRLTSPFNVMTGVALGATMMLSAPAFAKDAGHPTVQPVSVSQKITEIMTLEEIKKDPAFSKDKIILHYDNDIKGVDGDVLALNRRGFDTFAVPAGDTGCGVRLILSGMTSDKLCFTQSNLYRGDVGGTAIVLFPQVQARQSQQAQAAAAAAASIQHAALDQ